MQYEGASFTNIITEVLLISFTLNFLDHYYGAYLNKTCSIYQSFDTLECSAFLFIYKLLLALLSCYICHEQGVPVHNK